MCGIWALFGLEATTLSRCEHSFTAIHHRGPDAWRIEFDAKIKNVCVGFHRLSIVDCLYGMQPMKLHKYPLVTLLCNGELYNCKRLAKQYGFEYETKCDVECISQLYGKSGIEFACQNLDGVFAFCLIDAEKKRAYIARDPFGVRPLFRVVTEAGVLGICSEAKGLITLRNELGSQKFVVKQFPPGHVAEYSINSNGTVTLVSEKPFYRIGKEPLFKPFVPFEDLHPSNISANIQTLLTAAVEKRLMADRRIGCLLSGGLDSSLIAALLVKLTKKANLPYKIQSFAIGMGESPDLIAARQVAKHIGTEHHEITFDEKDVYRVLDKVLYHLETADITTVRASVGMYLIAEYIQAKTDTTVLFSGEGADELAQGYIYFRDAPNAEDAHSESLRLLSDIFMYDGLRADRTTSAHSLELRVPFLDQQFTHYFLSLPKESRQPQKGIEKHLLRSAFDGTDLLPNNILWRHKEAFSDGVTSVKKSLFQIIQEYIEPKLPNEALDNAEKLYPHCTPKTKESLYYRQKFEEYYKGQASHLMPYFWMPKWISVSDPSARFIKHYAATED
nr:PREDICTED: asparagine synthetase [glutamine-hydrolyzing] [Bemisia tabaci]